MRLGEKAKAKVDTEIIDDGIRARYDQIMLADQKDTAKGDRLNTGNYEYVNQLNQPVKSLTDKIIELLLMDSLSGMLPSVPLKDPKTDKEK